MIIIGRAANNHYMGIEDRLPPDEYICWDTEEKSKLIKKLNLKTVDICHKNSGSTTYKFNSGKLTIHLATDHPVFKELNRHIFRIKDKNIMSPLLFTYSWTRIKALFQSADINTWEENIKTHTYLYKKVIKNYPAKWLRLLDIWSSHLTFFGAMGYKQIYSEHSYKPYSTFTEKSLFSLFMHDGTTSAWADSILFTVDGPGKPSQSLFKRMEPKRKLAAIMERLYVDCTNEFILDELMFRDMSGLTIEQMFKNVVMWRASSARYPWIANYIITHYDDIMNEFDDYFVDQLEDAMKYQNHMLTKVI